MDLPSLMAYATHAMLDAMNAHMIQPKMQLHAKRAPNDSSSNKETVLAAKIPTAKNVLDPLSVLPVKKDLWP